MTTSDTVLRPPRLGRFTVQSSVLSDRCRPEYSDELDRNPLPRCIPQARNDVFSSSPLPTHATSYPPPNSCPTHPISMDGYTFSLNAGLTLCFTLNFRQFSVPTLRRRCRRFWCFTFQALWPRRRERMYAHMQRVGGCVGGKIACAVMGRGFSGDFGGGWKGGF